MNAQDIIDDFVRVVKNDKRLSRYVTDETKMHHADDIVEIDVDGNVMFHFLPFSPAVDGKLANGGKFYVKDYDDAYYDFDKNGFMGNIKNVPLVIVTSSGYVYDEDGNVIEKNGKIIYWSLSDLTKKANKTLKEKKLQQEIEVTMQLAREQLHNIQTAWNRLVDMSMSYYDKYVMHGHRTPHPRTTSRSGIRVDVRRMF